MISIGKRNRCELNIQIFITFSVIFALKLGFHSGISLVAWEFFVSETPTAFHLMYSYEIVVTDDNFITDDRFDSQTSVD